MLIINKKLRNTLYVFITLISILELYFIYKINIEYKGVYEIGPFIIWFAAQPFLSISLLNRKNESFLKARLLAFSLIILIIPISIYFTLPSYTYIEGKQIIERNYQQDKNITFVDSISGLYTIGLTNNPEQIFVRNKAYYYIVHFEDEIKYIMVNPLDGELMEIKESIFGD